MTIPSANSELVGPIDACSRAVASFKKNLLLSSLVPLPLDIAQPHETARPTCKLIPSPRPSVRSTHDADSRSVLIAEPWLLFASSRVLEGQLLGPLPTLLPKFARPTSPYMRWEIVTTDMIFQGPSSISRHERLDHCFGS